MKLVLHSTTFALLVAVSIGCGKTGQTATSGAKTSGNTEKTVEGNGDPKVDSKNANAVNAIQSMGGEYQIDETKPGKPIVFLRLTDKRIKDANRVSGAAAMLGRNPHEGCPK